jgi:hypothetical protein
LNAIRESLRRRLDVTSLRTRAAKINGHAYYQLEAAPAQLSS